MKLRWIEEKELFKNDKNVRVSTLRATFAESKFRIEDIEAIRVDQSQYAKLALGLIAFGILIAVGGIALKLLHIVELAGLLTIPGVILFAIGVVLRVIRPGRKAVMVLSSGREELVYSTSDAEEAFAITTAVEHAQALRQPEGE